MISKWLIVKCIWQRQRTYSVHKCLVRTGIGHIARVLYAWYDTLIMITVLTVIPRVSKLFVMMCILQAADEGEVRDVSRPLPCHSLHLLSDWFSCPPYMPPSQGSSTWLRTRVGELPRLISVFSVIDLSCLVCYAQSVHVSLRWFIDTCTITSLLNICLKMAAFRELVAQDLAMHSVKLQNAKC